MLTLPLLLPADFIMARMMLRGIKQRAEAHEAVETGVQAPKRDQMSQTV
jgi:hypothetical protein